MDKRNFNLKFDNFDCSLDTDAHVLIYFTAGLINRMHRIYKAAWCTSVNVAHRRLLDKEVKEQQNIGHGSPLYL